MNTFQRLCVSADARIKFLNIKGRAAENLVLEFFVGAATALQHANHPDAGHVAQCTQILIATRGLKEVQKVAAEAMAAEVQKETV